jgi:alpha-tubulin suppressor-like RCC1 family protein
MSSEVFCAGSNDYGELGDGTMTTALLPVRAGVSSATIVAAGTWHTCAVVAGGAVVCWGRNDAGQLGRSITSPYELAAADVGLRGVVKLVAGRAQTCALLDDATIACWGGNVRGSVGDGTFLDRPAPVAIGVPCP